MNLCSCTIVLKNKNSITFDNVEQSLGLIDQYGVSNISNIKIDAFDGSKVQSYHNLSIEDSIESLMSL